MEETIQEIFENLLTSLNVAFAHTEVTTEKDRDGEDFFYCNVSAKESSQLIGKRGRTLQALQHILKLIVFRRLDKQVSLMVDIDGYRKRQEDSVLEIAKRYIEKVETTGEKQSLPPMSPFFRRLVHLYIADNHKNLKTASEGYGNYRHIILLPESN